MALVQCLELQREIKSDSRDIAGFSYFSEILGTVLVLPQPLLTQGDEEVLNPALEAFSLQRCHV